MLYKLISLFTLQIIFSVYLCIKCLIYVYVQHGEKKKKLKTIGFFLHFALLLVKNNGGGQK